MTPKELHQSYKEEQIRKRTEQKLNSYYKNHHIQPKELKDTKEANEKEHTDKDQPTTGKSKPIHGTKKHVRQRRYR